MPTCKIKLKDGIFAIVDESDYEFISRYVWKLNKQKSVMYARCNHNKNQIYMHRLIMNPPPNTLIDHINRNGLDNRRSNLRLVDIAQNQWNRPFKGCGTSPYIGVRFDSRYRKYVAEITHYCKKFYLGSFDKDIDAATAYDDAALALRGDYATLNFR